MKIGAVLAPMGVVSKDPLTSGIFIKNYSQFRPAYKMTNIT